MNKILSSLLFIPEAVTTPGQHAKLNARLQKAVEKGRKATAALWAAEAEFDEVKATLLQAGLSATVDGNIMSVLELGQIGDHCA